MESWNATQGGFGFGFDDINFSDRLLHLRVVSALPSDTNSEFYGTDFNLRKLCINSLVLASKSVYFYRLFKNEMKMTQQRDEVNLQIDASEESGFMDMLKFIYGLRMSASSVPELVDVLMAADKFEVPSCVKHCVDLLLKLPMSMESALLYIRLHSCVLEDKLIRPLIDTMKKYLADRYRNFTEYQEELLGLPLSIIVFVLGIDGLQVDSEDVVLDFILKWARLNYPKLEERRSILFLPLLQYVCFSCVSKLKIKQVLDVSDFEYEGLLKLVLYNLLSKDQVLVTREYGLLPVKVVELEFTHPRCVVYLDIKKQQCADLSKNFSTQEFGLGEQVFSLVVKGLPKQPNFGLFLEVRNTTCPCTLDFEFAVMKKFSNKFVVQGSRHNDRVSCVGKGFPDLFKMSWMEFMSEESEYFIDGILHLRADITLLS